MKLIVAAVLLSLSCVPVPGQNTRITLCGRQLADARELLCFGAETVSKRAAHSNYLQDKSEDSAEMWSWGEHRGPLAPWSRFKRQGLAAECCINSCTQEVILSYC